MGKAASVWRRGNWEAWSSGQECRRSEDDLPSPRTWLCLDAPSPVRHVLLEWISVDRQSRDSSPLQNRTRSSLNVARLSHGDEWEGEKVDGEISFKRRSNSVVAWTGEAAQSLGAGYRQSRTPPRTGPLLCTGLGRLSLSLTLNPGTSDFMATCIQLDGLLQIPWLMTSAGMQGVLLCCE